jgi:hypothetical protein
VMLANDSALVELALRILSPETLHRISREARVRARETAKRGRCTSPGPAPSEELAEDREDWVDSEGAAAACPSTARKRGRRTSSLQPEVGSRDAWVDRGWGLAWARLKGVTVCANCLTLRYPPVLYHTMASPSRSPPPSPRTLCPNPALHPLSLALSAFVWYFRS